MNKDSELEQTAESIKEWFHKLTKETIELGGNKAGSYQDVFNACLYYKLAEFELRLRRLEQSHQKTQSFIDLHTPLI